MDSEDLQRYCLGKPYCGLCRFDFLEDELVLVCLDKNKAGTGYLTAVFPFEKEKTHDEPVEIHICCTRACNFSTKTVIGQHPDCFSLYARCGYPIHPTSEMLSFWDTCPYMATPAFQSATGFSFWPASGEEQRVQYIQDALAPRLTDGWHWSRALPLEVWRIVARYLARECAVIIAREQVPECEPKALSRTLPFSLTAPIYGSYISIDGQCYLKKLQIQPTQGQNSCLLFPGLPKEKLEDIYILAQVDHIGVRRLLFVREGSERWETLTRHQRPIRGVNWTYFRASEVSFLEVSMDALKVRDINTDGSLKFPLPLLVSQDVRDTVTDWQTGIYGYGPLRFVDFNRPDTTGYSVAYTGRNPVSIIAHRRNETVGSAQYDDVGFWLPCTWLYMPIDPGEHITDVSRQIRRKPFPTRCIDFILHTNRGRTHRFGGNGETICKYILRLAELSGLPYRMFFLHANNGMEWPQISNFYCEGADKISSYASFLDGVLAKMPRNTNRPLAFPITWEERRWMHSLCSLQEVSVIQLCRRMIEPHRPIIGMLVTYTSSHRECVGQWRFDWASQPMEVGETEALYFYYRHQIPEEVEEEGFYDEEEDREYFGDEEERSYYISAVSVRRMVHPNSIANHNCCVVPLAGKLDWWFTMKQESLYYEGESILQLKA